MLSWHRWDLAPHVCPAAGPRPHGPARELCVQCLTRLPVPSQLEGLGVRKRPEGRSAGGVGQSSRRQRRGAVISKSGRECVLCLHFGQGRGSMLEGGSETATLVGHPTRAVLPQAHGWSNTTQHTVCILIMNLAAGKETSQVMAAEAGRAGTPAQPGRQGRVTGSPCWAWGSNAPGGVVTPS